LNILGVEDTKIFSFLVIEYTKQCCPCVELKSHFNSFREGADTRLFKRSFKIPED
jgi:hypothetical protein